MHTEGLSGDYSDKVMHCNVTVISPSQPGAAGWEM